MKVRVKFEKTGLQRFNGHLDVMRYFQKALRRADVDVAFSGGFSPHMIMSFALPLGVGATSSGEYFDLELTREEPSRELVRRLNEQMAEGMRVLSVRRIPEDKASRCMSLVAAADYRVSPGTGSGSLPENTGELLEAFLRQEKIVVRRKTKHSDQETDIRPWIHALSFDGASFYMRLSAGSVSNLKPDLVMQAFGAFAGLEFPAETLNIHREELLADPSGRQEFVPLEELGEEIG